MTDRPLAEKWEIWRDALVGHSREELRAMEQGFFGGAGVVLSAIAEEGISEDELFDRIQSMLRELRSRIKTVRTN